MVAPYSIPIAEGLFDIIHDPSNVTRDTSLWHCDDRDKVIDLMDVHFNFSYLINDLTLIPEDPVLRVNTGGGDEKKYGTVYKKLILTAIFGCLQILKNPTSTMPSFICYPLLKMCCPNGFSGFERHPKRVTVGRINTDVCQFYSIECWPGLFKAKLYVVKTRVCS